MPTLFPHQERAIATLAASPYKTHWLAYEQGLGKTAIALRDFQAPGLAVVPAFLMSNWRRECETWRPDLRVVLHDTPGRKFDPTGLNIVSYGRLHAITVPPLRTLVLDEAHAIKSPDARRTQAAYRLIAQAPRVRLLTGTPQVSSHPGDWWPAAHAAGYTTMKWIDYIKRYCSAWKDKWGNWRMGAPKHLHEIVAMLDRYVLRLTKAEALQLPPKMRRIVLIAGDEPTELADFDPNEVLANPNKLAFVGMAEALRIAGEWKVPRAVEYIKGVLDDSDASLVVFAHHSSVIALLQAGLPGSAAITGATPMHARDSMVQRFQAGELRLLIGSVGAMGVGITLTAARHAIMVEAPWSFAAAVQAEDRLHRIGQGVPVQIDYLCVPKSLDHAVLTRMLAKRDLADELLDRTRILAAELIP